ncbi:hypothetical protein [Lamprobacter modestohalophilus]|uniref:hypothetical protein n=1 Tax=Lamprobacter modestohalophilus TaxID=1064514 RepID=UPI001F5BD9A6|nr:hypothetical protein [Lamprobacter modestohalophilus]
MKMSVITTLCNAVQTIDDCLDAMAAQSHADIAADYDLMLRVLSQLEGPGYGQGYRQGDRHEQRSEPRQGRVVYVPEVLVRMRLGGKSNRNLKQIAQKSWEDYQILRRQGQGGPPGTGPLGALSALAWKNLSKLPQFVRR